MNANKGKDPMQKILLLVLCVVVGFSGMVSGLATEEHGNKPVNKLNYTEWDGTGILPVLNDTNRIYSTWCNGNEYFYYKGDSRALNAFLKTCAKIKNAAITFEFKKGSGSAKTFSAKKEIPYTWNVNIKTGIAAAHAGEKKDKTVVVTIYVDGKTIQRKNLKIPETIEKKGKKVK
jgi:hypothetical protein